MVWEPSPGWERNSVGASQLLDIVKLFAKYCQAICEANKTKRLDWCIDRISEKEMFHNVIFTNESTIQLECHRRKCFKKKKTHRKLKYWQKRPLKVYVWGGICQQGATHFVIFTGIMNPTKYGDILSAYLLLYIEEELSDGHRLYQENDPKHTSKYIQRFFEQNGVTWRRSPIKSPDLNPIELVWGSANAGIEFLWSTL